MDSTPFEDLSDVYDAMIDWPKRLANEAPFFRRMFDRVGVHRVVDVACGTGRHAALFHSWQLEVQGADLSPQMIARARANFGEPDGLSWVVRGFHEAVQPAAAFDAAVCIGNSLTLARDLLVVERGVEQLLAAVRPGGVVLIQILNLWRLPDGPCQWQKFQSATLPQGEVRIIKGVHRSNARGFVELLVLEPNGGLLRSDSVRFLGLESVELELMARRAGAQQVTCYGDYQERPYERHKSGDLIVVIQK